MLRRIPPRRGRRLELPSRPVPLPLPASRPPSTSGATPQDHFNAPLYSLKAFVIATAVVTTSATASVVGLMTYLDVRDTAEFAARMRAWVSQSMPLLTEKIYRRPTSRDSDDDSDPVLLTPPASLPRASTWTTFDHEAAERRLGDAFDEGGLDAWAEAAVREMEAEIEMERARKIKSN